MLKFKKNLASNSVAARKLAALFSEFKHMRYWFFILMFILGCVNNQQGVKKIQYPDWIFNVPSSNGICYVGSALPHIRGKPYQRALAVSRAIEGIARQKNVTVNVDVEHLMYGNKDSASSKMMVYSVQTTKGQTVSAKIKDVWLDPYKEELFVLMCEE